MLDIMLNGKLSEAQDAGITLDIVKAEAPEALPISDTDICSLVMNIMNNAVKAAGVAGAVLPFIRLNIHVKNNYFAIRGGGHGHGAGMSQYGAKYLAKQGMGYEEILRHYYREVDITYLYQ